MAVSKKKPVKKRPTAAQQRKAQLAQMKRDTKANKNNPPVEPNPNAFFRMCPPPTTRGRPPKFETPEQLAQECLRYFEWAENNPLHEARLVSFQGRSKVEKLPKMRAMTMNALCLFIGTQMQTWKEYSEKTDFADVCSWAEACVREQKFAGAAADLLNPVIIARDLGLRDQVATPDLSEALVDVMKALSDKLPD